MFMIMIYANVFVLLCLRGTVSLKGGNGSGVGREC